MEEEGFIVSHAGSGSIVTFTDETASALRRQLILEDTRDYLASLKAMGLTLEEASALLTEVRSEKKEEEQ